VGINRKKNKKKTKRAEKTLLSHRGRKSKEAGLETPGALLRKRGTGRKGTPGGRDGKRNIGRVEGPCSSSKKGGEKHSRQKNGNKIHGLKAKS